MRREGLIRYANATNTSDSPPPLLMLGGVALYKVRVERNGAYRIG